MLALEFRSLAPRLGDLHGRRLIDAACGTGRWLAEARARGAQAFGADLARAMLLQAQAKPGVAGSLAQADLRRLPFRDASADVVICAFSLAYLPALEPAMEALACLVTRGGSLIVSDVHPEGHRRGWTRSFRRGLQVYEIEHQPYAADRLLAAGRAAGLDLEELLEPHFGEPERAIFCRAGKEQLFEHAREIPAVLIARWRRR